MFPWSGNVRNRLTNLQRCMNRIKAEKEYNIHNLQCAVVSKIQIKNKAAVFPEGKRRPFVYIQLITVDQRT